MRLSARTVISIYILHFFVNYLSCTKVVETANAIDPVTDQSYIKLERKTLYLLKNATRIPNIIQLTVELIRCQIN